MTRFAAPLTAFALLAFATPGHARSRDLLGTFTFFDADGKTGHDVEIQSMYLLVPPVLPTPVPADAPPRMGRDPDEQKSITMTAVVPVPDQAMLAWLRDAEHGKRHVVLKINDGTDDVAHVSTFETTTGQLTGLTMGYSGPGGGTQTITVQVDHLTINGAAAY